METDRQIYNSLPAEIGTFYAVSMAGRPLRPKRMTSKMIGLGRCSSQTKSNMTKTCQTDLQILTSIIRISNMFVNQLGGVSSSIRMLTRR